MRFTYEPISNAIIDEIERAKAQLQPVIAIHLSQSEWRLLKREISFPPSMCYQSETDKLPPGVAGLFAGVEIYVDEAGEYEAGAEA